MQAKLVVIFIMIGLIGLGCEKQPAESTESPPVATPSETHPPVEKPDTPETTARVEPPKKDIIEPTQGKTTETPDESLTLQWLGHASFKISHQGINIYIDPWQLREPLPDATLILISHGHNDHYSTVDIAKISQTNTKLIATADVIDQEKKGAKITPGQTLVESGVNIIAVPAYNPQKDFHTKEQNWVGFIIEIGGQRIYYAGDTDVIDEMKSLGSIDLALLPVGGTYTMNPAEAAKAVMLINPQKAIPCHWGSKVVGSVQDAEEFFAIAECEVIVLNPGDKITW